MSNLENIYQFILEMNKLKLVFRNTITSENRKESTAEHSWSATMIVMLLMNELKKEFQSFDELKTLQLTLIHDIVEIYAGDVIAFDLHARKNKEKEELDALKKLMQINPEFGEKLHDLWHEFEKKETIEAKIAKAADSICPLFLRLHSKQSYFPFNITIEKLDKTKEPYFKFSKVFEALFQKIKADLLTQKLIEK